MNNVKRWDLLRRSLRACHDAIDSGLIEIHNIAKISTVTDEDLETQIIHVKEVRHSIQDNLRQAAQLTDEMASVCAGDPIQSAQLSRLEAVTTNYTQDFHQAFQNVEQKIEKRKLLKSSVVGSQDLESGPAVEQQQLLREKDSISSSLDMLNNVISQGRESIGSLSRQQDRFAGVGKTLQQFTQRFPQLRSTMSRIHRAKLKQTIVLASVVACCLIFMVWYSF